MLFDVCDAAQLPANARVCRDLGGTRVLIVNTAEGVFACALQCTHEAASMEDGVVADGTIECPLHGAVFNLRDGTVEFGPAEDALPVYPASVVNGRVKVEIPDQG